MASVPTSGTSAATLDVPGMRLTAALSGSLDKLLADEVRAAESAVTAGVKGAESGESSRARRGSARHHLAI